MSKLLLVTSGKGGVGKTTFAVGIANCLASQGCKTVLLDLNFGLRNVDIYTGMENSILFDLGDVMSGVCGLSKAIVNNYGNPNLSILCGPQYRQIEGLTPAHVKALFESLKSIFEYVIVDIPASSVASIEAAAHVVDDALVLLTPDYSALRNADAVDSRLESLGIQNRFYAINQIIPELWGGDFVPGLDFIASTMRTPLVAMVQMDQGINIANNQGDLFNPSPYLYKMIYEIIGRIFA